MDGGLVPAGSCRFVFIHQVAAPVCVKYLWAREMAEIRSLALWARDSDTNVWPRE